MLMSAKYILLALWLRLAPLAVCLTPPDYSILCQNSADYIPSQTYTDSETGVTNTCDNWLDYFSNEDEGSPIFGEVFSEVWSCEGATPDVVQFVQGVAQLAGCCGENGRSACWADYSILCQNSADYIPSQTYTDLETGVTNTCDNWLDYFLNEDEGSPIFGEVFSEVWSCEGATPDVVQFVQGVAQVAGCCGENGRSACWADYSILCQNPADYIPSQNYTDSETGVTNTCDNWLDYFSNEDEGSPIFGEVFSEVWSCEGATPDVVQFVQGVAQVAGCCGENGRSACWADYSILCQNPADYIPSQNYTDSETGVTNTCDNWLDYFSNEDEGSPIFGEVFSEVWSCEGATPDVVQFVQGVAQVAGCCGENGRSACWADYSHVCENPGDYLPSVVSTDSDDISCDSLMSYFSNDEESPLFGTDFSQEWSCDGASPGFKMAVQMIAQTYGCCGETGKTPCWVDYSHVCQDPADYLPSHNFADGGSTCDTIMGYMTGPEGSPLFGADFSQEWSCDEASPDAKIAIQTVAQTYGCCGENGRSACWVDYSHVCENPGDYLPSVVSTDSDDISCDSLMSYFSNDEESPLFGTDFSQEWSCDGASPGFKMAVQMIAQTYGCCGETGKTPCWVDYSHVCQDPDDYLPSHNFADGESTCDTIMGYMTGPEGSPLFGADFSQDWSCDGAPPDAKMAIDMIAQSYGCCGENGKSACWDALSPILTPSPTKPEVDCFGLGRGSCKRYEVQGVCVWDRRTQKSCVPVEVDCRSLTKSHCQDFIRVGPKCTWDPSREQCWSAPVPDCPSLEQKRCKVFELLGDCDLDGKGNCGQVTPVPDCSSLGKLDCRAYEEAGRCVFDRMVSRTCHPAKMNCNAMSEEQCRLLEVSGRCYWRTGRQACADGPVPDCSGLSTPECKMFQGWGICSFDKESKGCSQVTPLSQGCLGRDAVDCRAAQWAGQCVWDAVNRRMCFPADVQCDTMEMTACSDLEKLGKCLYDSDNDRCSPAASINCSSFDRKTCKIFEKFGDCNYSEVTGQCT